MREIKFRAWDRFDNKWRYFKIGESFGQFGESIYKSICLDGATFQQYTGLKDKNGKEIYEDDIVEFYKNGKGDIPYDGERKIRTTPVYWMEFRGSWAVKFSELANTDLFKCHTICEVIGNIYEHPHLLKS